MKFKMQDKQNQLNERISDKHLVVGVDIAQHVHVERFLKSLFKYSQEEVYISKNPATKIKDPKLGKIISKFLSEQEIEHLRDSS